MNRPTSALIVDDEEHLRMYLKLILKGIGFTEFFEAENGKVGVDRYKAQRPDLVLMDVNMPVKEGLEALEDIHGLRRRRGGRDDDLGGLPSGGGAQRGARGGALHSQGHAEGTRSPPN